MSSITVLFIADTHLGFDLPFRPRIKRRRRGPDFFANYERALAPALNGEVNFVVHGGDLFYRSKVPAALVEMALAPLVRVANQGVPVYIVPGNHERSRIPGHLWTAHPNIHVFHQAETFYWCGKGLSVALSGFPFTRKIQDRFHELVARSGHNKKPADVRLLCLHQALEGSQVGPSNYTFRNGPEVIRGRDIPAEFDAVLAGHIHRGQILRHDLRGRRLRAPVIYPGSIERTSYAERYEDKYYVKLKVSEARESDRPNVDVNYVRLPTRPMVVMEIRGQGLGIGELTQSITRRLARVDPNGIVRIKISRPVPDETVNALTATYLRSLAPSTMNVSLRFV